MVNLELIQKLLVVATTLSAVTCAVVQKTKALFKTSNWLEFYSFILNLVLSVIFCNTFTDITFPTSLWVGLFSFVGADTIYKTLEGAIPSFSDLNKSDTLSIKSENLIDTDGDF